MRFRRYLLAACICCGTVAALISWQTSGWKATLKRELRRCSAEDGILFHSGTVWRAGTVLTFRLPAKAATILESHRREELLPCLAELQQSTKDPGEQAVISYCTLVVSHGLRGTPGTVGYTLGSKPRKVPVFDYCLESDPTLTDGQKQKVDGVIPPTEEEEEVVVPPRGQNPPTNAPPA